MDMDSLRENFKRARCNCSRRRNPGDCQTNRRQTTLLVRIEARKRVVRGYAE